MTAAGARRASATATGGGAGKDFPPESYTYNSVTGNLATKGLDAYTYSTTHKHAVTAAGGKTYAYDENGNMTVRTVSGQTYNFGYDAENHLTAVSGAAQVSFDYNGDGQRVVATEGVTTTVFVGNYFEWQVVDHGTYTSTQTTKYYYAGGTRVAMQRGGEGTKYLLGDHLGSASVVLNADGTARGAQGYKPWGEVNFTEGTIDTEYTYSGQYSYVSSFGMAYFNARWFLPELGRFNQADTLIPEASQGTIAWDRYAGMSNNTIKYIDPTGHWNTCLEDLYCGDNNHRSRPIREPTLPRLSELAKMCEDPNLSTNGKAVCEDYLRLNNEAGWWNHNIPGSMTVEEFLGLMLIWERAGEPVDGMLQEAVKNHLWMDVSQHGDPASPYCKGTTCDTFEIFNFMGAVMDSYAGGGGHITDRVDNMLDPKKSATTNPKYRDGENRNNIMQKAAEWGAYVTAYDPSRVAYNDTVPYLWGSRSKPRCGKILYEAPDVFWIYTICQGN